QNGSALGVIYGLPSPPSPPVLEVGGRSYSLLLDAGELGYDPYDGFVMVEVSGALPQLEADPLGVEPGDPQDTPEPATLMLGLIGGAGLLTGRPRLVSPNPPEGPGSRPSSSPEPPGARLPAPPAPGTACSGVTPAPSPGTRPTSPRRGRRRPPPSRRPACRRPA